MRTIQSSLFQRLLAQAEEADRKGLTKVASSLTTVATQQSNAVREDNGFYRYERDTFEQDLNDQLWQAVVRVADFYGIRRMDAEQVQTLVDKTAESMVADLCLGAGINHGVGAHEEPVAGEEETHLIVQEYD